MTFECCTDLIEEEDELAIYILNDLSGLHSNGYNTEWLKALDYLPKGVGWHLGSSVQRDQGRPGITTEPVEIIEHVIATILDFVKEHLLILVDQVLKVESHNHQDLVTTQGFE